MSKYGVRKVGCMSIQDQIIKWLVVAIFVTIFGITMALLLLVLNLLFEKFGFNEGVNGGVISAVGAIIGGSFTFIGVKWTLNNQQKEHFILKYPIKIKNIDMIYEKVSPNIDQIISFYTPGIDIVKEFKLYIETLIEKSVEVDGVIYTEIKRYQTEVDTMLIVLKERKYKILDRSSGVISPKYSEESLTLRQDLVDKINFEREKLVLFISNYKEKLQNKLIKYT